MNKFSVINCLLVILASMLSPSTHAHNKIAIFVVGMHRSGTSAMTGVLATFGIYLGEEVDGQTAFNPKGHFEHHATKRLDRILLDRLHTTWHDREPFSLDLESAVAQEYKQKIQDAWEYDLFTQAAFAVKDPCMCLLLPMHLAIARENGYTPHCIVMVRDPQEIALSLERRNKIPVHKGVLLVKKYMQSLQNSLNIYDVPTLSIKFNDLLIQPDKTIDRLKKFLPFLDDSIENRHAVKEFLDKNLKHHWYVSKKK